MQINEGSAYRRTISFETDGEPVIPTTVHWSLRCETTNTELVALTSVTPAASFVIVIPASANRMIRSTNPFEVKVITVIADYGLDTQRTADEKYRVRNMGGVADPVDDLDSDYGD